MKSIRNTTTSSSSQCQSPTTATATATAKTTATTRRTVFIILVSILFCLTSQGWLLWQGSVVGGVAVHDELPPVAVPAATTTATTTATATATATATTAETTLDDPDHDHDHDPDPDANCPFRNSSLYRSVYVYPTPGSDEWNSDPYHVVVNANASTVTRPYPWMSIHEYEFLHETVHYNIHSKSMQYNTELLVQDILTHPDSCLTTKNPNTATLFYIPYLPSIEYHNGTEGLGSYETSPYAQAILDAAASNNYEAWQQVFGLSSRYWQRRNGSDHLLTMSEPCHGLTHPKNRRGNYHYVHTQQQLSPLIVLSVELSTTFVQKFPMCARKNIVLPYPQTDGRWFNGKLETRSKDVFANYNITMGTSPAALQAEQQLLLGGHEHGGRPLTQYYNARHHGSCVSLRKSLTKDYERSANHALTKRLPKQYNTYELAYRQATFCPCPGGDTPSAKRMFDAILAGCIPIILSHDFVWPMTPEWDTVGTTADGSSSRFQLLNPNDFSIRLNASAFTTTHEEKDEKDTTKNQKANVTTSLQAYLETISPQRIQRLRQGLLKAQQFYGYYEFTPNLPDNPLGRVLPTGGAAKALVELLAERAKGALWEACQQEKDRVVTPIQVANANAKLTRNQRIDPYRPYQFQC